MFPCTRQAPEHLLSFTLWARRKRPREVAISHCHTAGRPSPRVGCLRLCVALLTNLSSRAAERGGSPGTEGGDPAPSGRPLPAFPVGPSREHSLHESAPPRRLCVSPRVGLLFARGTSSACGLGRAFEAVGVTALPPFPEVPLMCHLAGPSERQPRSWPGSSTVTGHCRNLLVCVSKYFCRLRLSRGGAGPEGTHIFQRQRCWKSSPKRSAVLHPTP